jgi:hypothetical protein
MTQEEFLQALPESVMIQGIYRTRDVYINGKPLSVFPSQQIYNHSPDGFNWGYGGSGPAQLALAIMMKYVDARTAQQYYHQFKFGFIATLPQCDFGIKYNLRQIMTDILSGSIHTEVTDKIEK